MGHTVLVQLWLMLGTLMEATQLREPSLSFVLGVVREQARLAFSIFICAIFMYICMCWEECSIALFVVVGWDFREGNYHCDIDRC